MAIRMKLNTILGEIEIDTYRNYTHVIVTKGEYLSRNYHLFDDSNWSKYENIEYRSGEKQAAGLKGLMIQARPQREDILEAFVKFTNLNLN